MAKYRPTSAEVSAPTTSGTAITVSDAHVVRVTNTASSTPHLITLLDSDDNTVGTMTLLGSESFFLDKPMKWKIFAANSAVKLVSVTYPS